MKCKFSNGTCVLASNTGVLIGATRIVCKGEAEDRQNCPFWKGK